MPRITEKDIERVLSQEEIVHACPRVVSAVTEAAKDPEVTARDLAKIIATDEALTARILKLVNSSFYGLSSEVATVTQAAVILGMREIMSLVYSLPAGNIYGKMEGSGLPPDKMWDHCVMVAVTARELSYSIRYPVPEEVFVGGILHDIGKPLMADLIGPEYAVILAKAESSSQATALFELEEYGTSHPEIGGRLLEQWDFPPVLIDCARGHHSLPLDPQEHKAAILVLIANRLAKAPSREDLPSVIDELTRKGAEILGVTLRQLVEARIKAEDAYEEIRQVFHY